MISAARPWILEVATPGDEPGSWSWEKWSTYRAEDRAAARVRTLETKGRVARVRYSGEPCSICSGTDHPDGECLL